MARHKIVISEKAKVPIIAAAIAVFTIIVAYNLIYKRQEHRKKQLTTKIEDAKQSLVLRKKIAEISDIKERHQKFFYYTADVNILRDSISSLARKAGVNIVSIHPQESEKFGNYSKLSFSLRVRCDYDRLGKFMEYIENCPTLTTVEDIELQAVPLVTESQEKYIAEVSLVINAYING